MSKDRRPSVLAIGRALGCGHSMCPKCGSDHWKSAKMILLQGTYLTDGEISGSARNPGILAGGNSAFLLSEYWFTRNYPLDATINLTTRSALVDEVKQFMVECWSKLQNYIERFGQESGQWAIERYEAARDENKKTVGGSEGNKRFLWNHCRVCMRCGSIYLGQFKVPKTKSEPEPIPNPKPKRQRIYPGLESPFINRDSSESKS